MGENYFIFEFNGKEFKISKNLQPIVEFLNSIEEEIQFLIFPEKEVELMENWLRQNEDILISSELGNFYSLPSVINLYKLFFVKKFRTIRSELIALFSFLETLFCLYVSYENKLCRKKEIIDKLMDRNFIENLYESFCLSPKNEGYKNNLKRLENISAKEFRDLRNNLTHFYSVPKSIGLTYLVEDERTKELERATNWELTFISPYDLYQIVIGCKKLILERWLEDYKNFNNGYDNEFDKKISSVLKVVEEFSPSVLSDNR
jgi:hypothetical protein